MNIVNLWRQEIRGLLPCGFLKISREAGFLFVSDYPLRMEKAKEVHEKLAKAGFSVTVQKGMAYLDAGREKYEQAARKMPSFAAPEGKGNKHLLFLDRLLMQGKEENFALAGYVLRCTALGDEKGLLKLPLLIALQKRKKAPLSPLAGKVLLQYVNEKQEE